MGAIENIIGLIIYISAVILIAIIILTCCLISAIFRIRNATEQALDEMREIQENQIKIYNKMCGIEEDDEEEELTSLSNDYK